MRIDTSIPCPICQAMLFVGTTAFQPDTHGRVKSDPDYPEIDWACNHGEQIWCERCEVVGMVTNEDPYDFDVGWNDEECTEFGGWYWECKAKWLERLQQRTMDRMNAVQQSLLRDKEEAEAKGAALLAVFRDHRQGRQGLAFVHTWAGEIEWGAGTSSRPSPRVGGGQVMSKLGCCIDRDHGSPRGCKPSTCMELPAEKTCADCAHTARCVALFGKKEGDTSCDFHPRRFLMWPSEQANPQPPRSDDE